MNHALKFFRTGGLLRQRKQQFLNKENWNWYQIIQNKSNKQNYITIKNIPIQINCSGNKIKKLPLLNFSSHIEKREVGIWRERIFQKNKKWGELSLATECFNSKNEKDRIREQKKTDQREGNYEDIRKSGSELDRKVKEDVKKDVNENVNKNVNENVNKNVNENVKEDIYISNLSNQKGKKTEEPKKRVCEGSKVNEINKVGEINKADEVSKVREINKADEVSKVREINKSSKGNGLEEINESKGKDKDIETTHLNDNATISKQLDIKKKKYNGLEKKIIKINYFRNIQFFPLTKKKYKEFFSRVKNKKAYRILSKRIKIEKNKITAVLLKYQMKKGKLKRNLNEQIYRKAVINVKKKIMTFFNRNCNNHIIMNSSSSASTTSTSSSSSSSNISNHLRNNKSIMDIYYEEKKKYKLRKQRLFELQEKVFKNSINAQTGIKKFFKKYGYIGLTTYFLIFLLTFISSYLCFHYKYISLSDLEYLSEKMHLHKYFEEHNLHKKIDSLWGELLCAYLAAKISEPIRIVVTILITPYIQKILKLKKRSRML